ncbi:nucleotide pyrophosphohydrolase, partial [Thermincola ferriacetica]
YWHPLSMLARMTEEVGELAREINHRYGQKPKKDSEPEGSIALELADILFIIICLANSLNLDLESAFKAMMQKYRVRDINRWTRKNGG